MWSAIVLTAACKVDVAIRLNLYLISTLIRLLLQKPALCFSVQTPRDMLFIVQEAAFICFLHFFYHSYEQVSCVFTTVDVRVLTATLTLPDF